MRDGDISLFRRPVSDREPSEEVPCAGCGVPFRRPVGVGGKKRTLCGKCLNERFRARTRDKWRRRQVKRRAAKRNEAKLDCG